MRVRREQAAATEESAQISGRAPVQIRPAKVILLSSAKGGSAKTTSTRCLAAFAARDNYRVATIDLDLQRTLTRWWNRRPDTLPPITHFDRVRMEEAGEAVREIAALDEF